MLCPVCKVELQMSDRQGVEIDYCPKCRGVWLDRGELDKIIERSAEYEQRLRTSSAPTSTQSRQTVPGVQSR
jgi:Zn-finger nucleic acid-binding protein